ncbi:hypothetical protein MNB_SUP05-5-651 [hydrothermal vent metagenome]|uniref:HTH merR-type domain-containing protein n=1 Tax=hydrothermal vent metagenome TaxID=652676 RepID=A0A1W1C2A1_9ZZZZ
MIRYWQKEFKQLKPKILNNQRRYQKKDISLILEIKELLYNEKLTIQGALKRLDKDNKITEPLENDTDKIYIKKELENILQFIRQ